MANKTPEQHSRIVGGSTAKRVMHCPGSVKISQAAPTQESSKYADEGTLLHNAMAKLMSDLTIDLKDLIGMEHEGIILTQEHLDDKITPALAALDEVDPDYQMKVLIETEVGFAHKELKGVFGTCDVIGKLPDRAVVLDWKFGNGVMVEAEENYQLMFYAAGALRTENTKSFFEHSEKIELVIVQPPFVRRWETTVKRIKAFEKELISAVKEAKRDDATLKPGEWCKWCPAQQINLKTVARYCPMMNQALTKMSNGSLIKTETGLAKVHEDGRIEEFNVEDLGRALGRWRNSIQPLGEHIEAAVRRILEAGGTVPGWKLVQGKKSRDWKDEAKSVKEIDLLLQSVIEHDDQIDTVLYGPAELRSVAQIEKELKKLKLKLPSDLVAESYSNPSLVPESDKREPIKIASHEEVAEAFGKIAKPKTQNQ